jgi:hypothetical protein
MTSAIHPKTLYVHLYQRCWTAGPEYPRPQPKNETSRARHSAYGSPSSGRSERFPTYLSGPGDSGTKSAPASTSPFAALLSA